MLSIEVECVIVFKHMKRLWIGALLVFAAAVLWPQQIDLPLLGRAPLNIFSAMTFYQDEGSILTDGISHMRNRLVRIELERGRVSEYFEIHRFLGAVEDRILVSTVDREHILKLRFVDPESLALAVRDHLPDRYEAARMSLS